MAPSYRQRDVVFRVERDNLIRVVRGTKRGEYREYEHVCVLDVLKEVAFYIEEVRYGTTTGELWEAFPDLAKTQISVALDFLKERGCVRVMRRRVYAASACTFEDAMIEFCWLQHQGEQLCGT